MLAQELQESVMFDSGFQSMYMWHEPIRRAAKVLAVHEEEGRVGRQSWW